MKSISLLTYGSLVCAASAFVLPQARDSSSNSTSTNSTIDDTVVLNFALTLEHLENAFYTGALNNFTEDDFINDGLPSWARGRFEQIASHEQSHVELLTSALGDNATKACNYSFPYTSPSSFAALSQVLEGVGVSAYAGAAQYVSSKSYLTTAAVILSTEARHAAWVAGPVNKENPWNGPFDTPLGLDVIYTLAAQFITSCPSSNPSLPVKAFPALTFGDASPGQAANITADGVSTDGQYVAFFSGLSTIFVPVQDGQVVVPNKTISYAVLTNSNTTADDSTISAGVAILQFPFNSNGTSLSTTGESSMNVGN
ncbi:ferritin-like domain-containing protein [Lentinula raphanica]|nr:ferritin-like domain-containing protein [Lentinula raphanica]KAJ3770473.1 ferritin-like domain-containing protein [Lentinula raphanica]